MTTPDRLRDELVRLVDRGLDVRAFSLGAAQLLARSVPFDGVSLLTMDPATRLVTGAFVKDGLRGADAVRIAEIEYLDDDVNTFRALARSGRRAASLSETTGGELDRSLRHRELRAPNGFGDELRAVLASNDSTWGGLTLGRAAGREPFGPAEVAFVASLSGYLGEGLRRAMLLAAPSLEQRDPARSASLALLEGDNSVSVADTSAEAWLADLADTGPDTPVPPVVATVASRARSIAGGRESSDGVARARVRTPSGTWLTVRGSVLGGGEEARAAVTFEPTGPDELAPLVADAYELTGRERAVTQHVALGLTTDAIADRLQVSPWTVQDHLKSIFEKTGVSSRGELVARIFFEHHAPRLTDGGSEHHPSSD